MYSERQHTISDNKATQLKNNSLKSTWWKYVTKHIPDKEPERVLFEAREALTGIEQTESLRQGAWKSLVGSILILSQWFSFKDSLYV